MSLIIHDAEISKICLPTPVAEDYDRNMINIFILVLMLHFTA